MNASSCGRVRAGGGWPQVLSVSRLQVRIYLHHYIYISTYLYLLPRWVHCVCRGSYCNAATAAQRCGYTLVVYLLLFAVIIYYCFFLNHLYEQYFPAPP